MTFILNMPGWLSTDHEVNEVGRTSGFLTITVGDRVATHAEDDLSKSVRDDVFVSAYPLALWFASSWWRLRWEPAPDAPGVAWRMAHEMTAAGHGFLWPRLMFEFDGERIDVVSRQSDRTPIEPMRFLESFRRTVEPSDFENAVDAFIEMVTARLAALELRDTDLERIWGDVCAERRDRKASAYRKLEAELGYDPDEAPADVIDQLGRLLQEAGKRAVSEIAPVCAGNDPRTSLANVITLANSPGINGAINLDQDIAEELRSSAVHACAPWERGWQLARIAREQLRLGSDKVTNEALCGILGVSSDVFRADAAQPGPPLGLAVKKGLGGDLSLHFRSRNHRGRRFEGARFLADFLSVRTDSWLPITDMKTARQKVQRAFATEFLCPIDQLKGYLGGDFSDEAIEDAGAYFDVSPRAVASHLSNNNVLPAV